MSGWINSNTTYDKKKKKKRNPTLHRLECELYQREALQVETSLHHWISHVLNLHPEAGDRYSECEVYVVVKTSLLNEIMQGRLTKKEPA